MSKAKPRKDVSIVLPAYNEALQIEDCILQVEKAIQPLSGSYEIIVSEDGSTDGTDCIVTAMSKRNPNLILLHSFRRLGKGKAIKNAVKKATGDIVVFMDVDLATSLRYLPQVLRLVRKNGGMVIGSRHVEGSRVERRASRTLFSLAYNLFVRVLFLDNVHDHQCGFKAMRREVAEELEDIQSNGFFFDTEMILRCKKAGFPVLEMGVEWSENRAGNTSKVRLFHDAAKIGMDMLKYRFKSGEEKTN